MGSKFSIFSLVSNVVRSGKLNENTALSLSLTKQNLIILMNYSCWVYGNFLSIPHVFVKRKFIDEIRKEIKKVSNICLLNKEIYIICFYTYI